MRRTFWGILQKLVPHRSLTLPFEPFRFWLRIRRDMRSRKTTPRLVESATLRLGEYGRCWLSNSASRGVDNSLIRQVGESPTPRLENVASLRRRQDFSNHSVRCLFPGVKRLVGPLSLQDRADIYEDLLADRTATHLSLQPRYIHKLRTHTLFLSLHASFR
jgi:hypothetical protein